MVMAPIWILMLSVYITHSAQAVDLSEASFVSAESGENVTLLCKFVEKSGQSIKSWVWYKQRAGQEPQEVAVKLINKFPNTLSKRFKINQSFNLTIEQTTKADEGMYFCGVGDGNTIMFSNGTFLAMTDKPRLNISVLQTPVRGSVSPGESVTLQCTVLSEIRAAELRVLWFRAAAGQSFPEIIYTHQNSSSHQCEISSSTHSSVYNFSKNILDQHHTGTYYCAVVACGKIIWGCGSTVEMEGPVHPVVIFLGAALGVCVVVISAQAFMICKRRNSDHCSVRNQQGSAAENTTSQAQAAENLNYAAINFKENKPKTGRVKREQPEDIVYSQVRSSNAKAHRSHR
ncbi:uncharacterized protein LOC118806426 [Colossoma macropomum]|uniref:uncharacterized protein LOC118806426 n=1 Tax=Colossoma macropomum TaxID=42526 RepID=UPI001863DDEA|nr:uncharacterized protein LOC118806426 [Colossoma macropomum]